LNGQPGTDLVFVAPGNRVTVLMEQHGVLAASTYTSFLQAITVATTTPTLQAATNGALQTILAGLNGSTSPAVPVTITVNLGDGSFGDVSVHLSFGVTLVLVGDHGSTTIVGHSPALTVSSGQVIVLGVTFTTGTDAPTMLLTGGELILRNDTIQESAGGTDSALSLAGGTLDIGTDESLGNNIVNVNGTGEFLHNTTLNSVSTTGTTFSTNDSLLPASFLSFTSVSSSVGSSVFGQNLTFTAAVLPDALGSDEPSGSIDFFDTSTNTDLGTVPLIDGVASLSTASLGAGDHTILATYGGDGNYLPSLDSLSVTISPAVLTVTADSVSTVYGAPLPAFPYTITGFVNNDGPGVVSGVPELDTNATTSSNVGTYAIMVSQGTLSAANYTFTFQNGILTVTPAPITVQSVQVNDGLAQHSMVTSLTVSFSQPITALGAGAFEIDLGMTQLFPTDLAIFGNQVLIRFTGLAGVHGSSLRDGRYLLVEHAGFIHDYETLADHRDMFFRLFGDVNGDGKVDSTDRTAFLAAYRSRRGKANYAWYFDYNADGVVDSVDYSQLLGRYGRNLP
jgi:hypothetical protein